VTTLQPEIVLAAHVLAGDLTCPARVWKLLMQLEEENPQLHSRLCGVLLTWYVPLQGEQQLILLCLLARMFRCGRAQSGRKQVLGVALDLPQWIHDEVRGWERGSRAGCADRP